MGGKHKDPLKKKLLIACQKSKRACNDGREKNL